MLPDAFSVARCCWTTAARCSTAFASLPYDDGSAFYREHEYFRNVASFADVFDYVHGSGSGRRRGDACSTSAPTSPGRPPASPPPAGAPSASTSTITWSPSRVLRRRGPAYAVVNMDMHLPAWRAGAFDLITAFNALHHTHRIEALIGTLTAALRPGGRLCVVEPVLVPGASAAGVRRVADRGRHQRERLSPRGVAPLVRSGRPRARDVPDRPLVQRRLREARRWCGRGPCRWPRPKPSSSPATIAARSRGPAALPGLVPAGARVEVPIRVANRSGRAAGAATARCRCVSATTFTGVRAASGRWSPMNTRGRRSAGTCCRAPMRTCACRWRCRVDPGVYDVEIDLIHEGRSWFAGQGMSPWNLQVEVGRRGLRRRSRDSGPCSWHVLPIDQRQHVAAALPGAAGCRAPAPGARRTSPPRPALAAAPAFV